jgi:hypothetical protein
MRGFTIEYGVLLVYLLKKNQKGLLNYLTLTGYGDAEQKLKRLNDVYNKVVRLK